MAQIDWSQVITKDMKAERARAAMLARLDEAVQSHIDRQAREHGYRDSFALASYAGSTVPKWAAEAMAFVAWRDGIWLSAHKVAASNETPEMEAFIAALPPVEWPA